MPHKKRRSPSLNPVQYSRNQRKKKNLANHSDPALNLSPQYNPPEDGTEDTIQESSLELSALEIKDVFKNVKEKASMQIVDHKFAPLISEKDWANFEEAFIKNSTPDYDKARFLCWHKDLPKKKQKTTEPVNKEFYISSVTGWQAPRPHFHYCSFKRK